MLTFVPGRFDGLTVIVTGAGSGIGRATAVRLMAEGATVIAGDISGERLAGLAVDGAGRLVTVTCDVTLSEDLERLVGAAGGRVDGLVNNAGIMDGFLTPSEVDDATWERVLAVNLTSAMRLTRAVLPIMIGAGGGSIVNVSSEASIRGGCAGVAYTASKHALNGLTRSVAVHHRAQGVRCNAVAPGGVATNVDGSFRSSLAGTTVGPFLQATLPPMADPGQLAASIVYLLSDDAANVNGAVLMCDGGWSAL